MHYTLSLWWWLLWIWIWLQSGQLLCGILEGSWLFFHVPIHIYILYNIFCILPLGFKNLFLFLIIFFNLWKVFALPRHIKPIKVLCVHQYGYFYAFVHRNIPSGFGEFGVWEQFVEVVVSKMLWFENLAWFGSVIKMWMTMFRCCW